VVEEASRKMRDTASETLALPFEDAASFFSSPITNHKSPITLPIRGSFFGISAKPQRGIFRRG
jgi:hypothetical protein